MKKQMLSNCSYFLFSAGTASKATGSRFKFEVDQKKVELI